MDATLNLENLPTGCSRLGPFCDKALQEALDGCKQKGIAVETMEVGNTNAEWFLTVFKRSPKQAELI